MNKIIQILQELREMDLESSGNQWIHLLHPVVKVMVTITYILFLVSYSKYALSSILIMGIYPAVMIIMGDISLKKLWKRLKAFFLLAFFLGIANPFFDHRPIFSIGNITITGGILSFITLYLKGIFAITASYLLIISTKINDICYAFRCLRLPKFLVSIFLLIYRYLFLLLEEAEKMMQAYALRAPGQKGIHFKVWGSMIGQMLLRSMDLAEVLYDSMRLRGFHGEYYFESKRKMEEKDYLFLMICLLFFILLRFFIKF
ncbi:MAG: cobalt ECF transporter T component CbiQ [Eubacteriales bacterium]|nr:cobalt ECF transporter T component CbiQ [Eubacteriales bacterium]